MAALFPLRDASRSTRRRLPRRIELDRAGGAAAFRGGASESARPRPRANHRRRRQRVRDQLADYRHDLGLDYPYGSKAVALKIASMRPTPGSRQVTVEDPVEPADQLLQHRDLDVDPDPPSAGHEPQNAAEVDLDDLPF